MNHIFLSSIPTSIIGVSLLLQAAIYEWTTEGLSIVAVEGQIEVVQKSPLLKRTAPFKGRRQPFHLVQANLLYAVPDDSMMAVQQ
jgi:hypothetical protein